MKTVEQLPFPELLDITEAAEFLCTSIRHMRRLVAEDKLSVVKIGGKLRFDRADLQKFIDDHRRARTRVVEKIAADTRRVFPLASVTKAGVTPRSSTACQRGCCAKCPSRYHGPDVPGLSCRERRGDAGRGGCR